MVPTRSNEALNQEELTEFYRLLDRFLATSRDESKQTEYRQSGEITTRDQQAMYNFHQEGISLETIAQHFACSVAFVSDTVMHRPWLLSQNNPRRARATTWLESDHSDPLEMVKIYYPEYLPDQISPETEAKEAKQAITWQEYLDTVDWDEAYQCYGDRCSDVIMENAQEIAARSGIVLSFQ